MSRSDRLRQHIREVIDMVSGRIGKIATVFLLAIAFACLASCGADERGTPAPKATDSALTGSVLVAIEDGPLIVEAKFKSGYPDVSHLTTGDGKNYFYCTPPATWTELDSEPYGRMGRKRLPYWIPPMGIVTELLPLHQNYSIRKQPPFSFGLYVGGKRNDVPFVVRSPEISGITLLPASPKNLADACDTVRKMIPTDPRFGPDFDRAVRLMLNTPHAQIDAFLLECLDSHYLDAGYPQSTGLRFRIFETLYGSDWGARPDDGEIFPLLIRYLSTHRPKDGFYAFVYFPYEDGCRSARFRKLAGDRLRNAPNLWVRYLWNRRMESDDQDGRFARILREIETEMDPIPAKDFATLLSELDDDRFSTRESASRKLVRCGPGVLPQIQKALAATPGEEVRSRLNRATKSIRADKLTRTETDIVESLMVRTKPGVEETIAALLRQKPPSPMAIAYAAAVERRKDDR